MENNNNGFRFDLKAHEAKVSLNKTAYNIVRMFTLGLITREEAAKKVEHISDLLSLQDVCDLYESGIIAHDQARALVGMDS